MSLNNGELFSRYFPANFSGFLETGKTWKDSDAYFACQENCRLLANILTFCWQNIIQHVHRTS
jgi:hypothetical protein